MLASDLTSAEKLAALVASEQATASGDVPMNYAGLAGRLNMAARTVRAHLAAVRESGWLSQDVTVRPAPGRPLHRGAQVPNGVYGTGTRSVSTHRPPSTVNSVYAPATVSYDKSVNGVYAPATVPIETPVQSDAVATGARHRRTAATQAKGAARRERGPKVIEGQPEAGRVGGPGADGEAPGTDNGPRNAAHHKRADGPASRANHQRPDWPASFVGPDDDGWPPPEPDGDLQPWEVTA